MEINHYIDTSEEVTLTFESGTVYLKTYSEKEGWSTFTLNYNELKKFMRVVEIVRE
jgi:hypothetical protein